MIESMEAFILKMGKLSFLLNAMALIMNYGASAISNKATMRRNGRELDRIWHYTMKLRA